MSLLARIAQPSHPATQRPRIIVLEPESEGDITMASIPASIQPLRTHPTQPRYNNPCPCATVNFFWNAHHGAEMIGLPKTRAGMPHLPNKVGLCRFRLENNATPIDEVN